MCLPACAGANGSASCSNPHHCTTVKKQLGFLHDIHISLTSRIQTKKSPSGSTFPSFWDVEKHGNQTVQSYSHPCCVL